MVDGLIREGETANIISYSKVGKSWLAYDLALSVITGDAWLGQFPTRSGKVLLIDNELHRPTLAHRIPTVGDAKAIARERYDLDLEVWPLRGNLRSWGDLAVEFQAIQPREYKLIILDAKYRFLMPGVSENDNAAETQTYNRLDEMADHTKAAIVLVHHASKGSQTDKRVTVGAGAGAQSRAADCHLVLREHEEEGVVVLEAAVRSFAPVKPLPLRWGFPLWLPELDVDPAKLKGRLTQTEHRQNNKDKEGIDAIVRALLTGRASVNELIRRGIGMGKPRAEKLRGVLKAEGQVDSEKTIVEGNHATVYWLTE